jgi:ankyrin repeat protein
MTCRRATVLVCSLIQLLSARTALSQPVAAEASGGSSRAYSAGRDIVVNYREAPRKQAPRAEAAREALAQLGLAYDNETFVAAAKRGDTVAVRHFLRAGMTPNLRTSDNDNATPLIEAVRSDARRAATLLLQAGADPEIVSAAWGTALEVAARHGRYELATLLLDQKPSRQNKLGALMQAARSGSLRVLRLLFRVVAPDQAIQDRALLSAAEYGDYDPGVTDCVSFLIEQGANPDASNDAGRSSVSLLAVRANLGALRVVLGRAKLLEARDPERGATPLWWAAGSQQRDNVELLLAQGADIDALSRAEISPLMHAAELGDLKMVRFLLERGADVHRGQSRLVVVQRAELRELLTGSLSAARK